MSLEAVLLGLGLAVVALLAWRETRVRRVSKQAKTLKLLQKRVEKLEAELSGVPDSSDLAEFESKLQEVESKVASGTPGQFKILVDRVNQVSNDASALKLLVEDTKNRLVKLETGVTWSKIGKREGT